MKLFIYLALALVSSVHAQLPVGVDLPAGSVITVSEDRVVFDLSGNYPPPSFPAYYGLPAPVTVKFFSNVDGNWSLKAGVIDGLVSDDGAVIPVSQLEYRLDGAGEWRSLGQSVVLLTRLRVSTAYETALLELRLKLVGNERPGRYRGVLDLTLTGL